MNAIFLYFFCITLTGVLSQQFNEGNFFTEDADYQDIPLSAKSLPPQRAAKPRSPAIASASQPKVTPVPILKQINRHNEDGSYTYGFEGADGSFKIETKLATGEVIGKYGYVDDNGKVRTVEYGANKYGFQPSGEGITIPPITIGNETETEAPEEEQQFIQVPVRTPKPPKRKPQKFNPVIIPEQPPRPQQSQVLQQIPQQPYFVREEDDIRPQNQRQFAPTPSDINSLELVLGNEFREPPSFQFRPEIPQRKTFQSFRPEEENPEDRKPLPRPIFNSLPIPSGFEAAQPQPVQPSQFIPNDFAQQQFDFSNPRVANAFRQPNPAPPVRSQSRPRQKPQVLFLAPADETAQPNAIRRNSNPSQDTRSILDELLKQYPIPNGSPAINDFSFSQAA